MSLSLSKCVCVCVSLCFTLSQRMSSPGFEKGLTITHRVKVLVPGNPQLITGQDKWKQDPSSFCSIPIVRCRSDFAAVATPVPHCNGMWCPDVQSLRGRSSPKVAPASQEMFRF